MAKVPMEIQPNFSIQFEDLLYTVQVPKQKEKKQVLKGVSGRFKSGELTAIMGPSGAGKSSLLNILTGFTTKGVKGDLSINGKSLDRKSRKLCSYILQDDNLLPNFTILESMTMAANLKISNKSMNRHDKQTLIDNILNTLHLTFSKNTKCSKLSGGQKKRLSIALELIDNPLVLFLDEPTTGLDSSSTTYTIKLLHSLAREGRIIVCTIHQPSAVVYEMFDHVYVLADGQCVYQGSSLNTVEYLAANGLECPQYHNSADYILEVANGEYGNFTHQLSKSAIDNRWRASQLFISNQYDTLEALVDVSGATDNEKNSLRARDTQDMQSQKSIDSGFVVPSEMYRLWVLIKRCNVQLYRDWSVTHLKLLVHILCAILVGFFFGDSGSNASKSVSNCGYLLVCIVYLSYTTLMPAVLRFPAEVPILKKETFNSWYKLRTYFLANLITATPTHIIFSTVFASITFLLTDQPMDAERFLKFTLILVLTVIVLDGFGIFLGTILDPINGTFFGAISICFMFTFSGFLAFFNHIPKTMLKLSYLSVHRYCLEGLVLSLYDNNRTDLVCPDDVMYCQFKKPSLIIRELGLKHQNYDIDVGMILLQLVFFKTISYFALKRRLNHG